MVFKFVFIIVVGLTASLYELGLYNSIYGDLNFHINNDLIGTILAKSMTNFT